MKIQPLIIQVTLLAAAILLAACTPALLDPPRRQAQAAIRQTATAQPDLYISSAPTPTPGSSLALAAPETEIEANATITLWVNETSARHAQVLQQMSADFSRRANIHVEIILVAPKLLPELMATAAISDTLPDLVLHPIEYTLGWTEQGILDATAASAVVAQLGRNTFDPDALERATVGRQIDGHGLPLVAAVPSDGWKQLLIYRADWFSQHGLAPPDSYEAMLAAAATFFQPDSLTSGLVVPTESTLVSTQQVFEQLALANGCHLINAQGEVTILRPACLGALDFYRQIVNQYSPSDVQTDTSARNAYLAGRTAMFITSPRALVALAGLDRSAPATCAECATPDYLAQQSGFITEIRGDSALAGPAAFSDLTYLGITRSANQVATAAFIDYWLNDGYLDWLSIAPEHKIPLRWGTREQPTYFLESWGSLPLVENGPSLPQIYGPDMAGQLSLGIGGAPRWGFSEGQGALMSRLYENLTISIVLQEMLSGYFSSSQAVIEAHKRVVDYIPNYAFDNEAGD